jgi:hypothetical protein
MTAIVLEKRSKIRGWEGPGSARESVEVAKQPSGRERLFF